MGFGAIPFIVFTVLWGVVGIVLPFVVPKGPNRGIIQVILMLTAATCWLFWLCCYMAQMNPLIGPKMNRHTIMIMAKEWVRGVGVHNDTAQAIVLQGNPIIEG